MKHDIIVDLRTDVCALLRKWVRNGGWTREPTCGELQPIDLMMIAICDGPPGVDVELCLLCCHAACRPDRQKGAVSLGAWAKVIAFKLGTHLRLRRQWQTCH